MRVGWVANILMWLGSGSKLRNRAQHRVATGLVIVSIGVGDELVAVREKHKEGDFEEDGFRDGDV